MAPPFSDTEQAVSYTSALPPGSEQQSGYMPFLQDPQSAYTLSSALGDAAQEQFPGSCAAAPSFPPPSEARPERPMPSQQNHHHGCGSQNPMTTYHPDRPRNQHLLGSPYYTAAETDKILYAASPSSTSLPFGTYSSCSFPVSDDFPPATLFQLTTQGYQGSSFDLRKHWSDLDFISSKGCILGTPKEGMSYQSGLPQFGKPISVGLDGQKHSPKFPQDHSPPMLTSCANSPYEPNIATPTAMEQPQMATSHPQPSQLLSQPIASQETQPVDAEKKKTNEPYAKLIERALLSASNYRMQLQDIYAWFAENTDKAARDGRGWQNSIRHNLSMNAAFVKTQDQKRGHGPSGSDAKRSTEWMLEDWAVADGVQSTTRYRKANSSRKASGARSAAHFQPYRLDMMRRGPTRVLASHGEAWQRRRSPPLRGAAPYGTSAPLGQPFQPGFVPAAPATLSMSRSDTPDHYRCTYALPPRFDSGAVGQPDADHSFARVSQAPSGDAQPYGFLPESTSASQQQPISGSLPSSDAGAAQGASSLYYNFAPGQYPYSVTSVPLEYGRYNDVSSSMGSHPHGLCGMDGGEI